MISLTATLLFLFVILYHEKGGLHHWEHRGPDERHCTSCGRCEIKYLASTQFDSFWRTLSRGTVEKHSIRMAISELITLNVLTLVPLFVLQSIKHYPVFDYGATLFLWVVFLGFWNNYWIGDLIRKRP